MKTFYGNYLGVVVTGGEKDPEGRGRTQIFVPNVMPALYDNWNKEGNDITFEVIGQGLEGELSPDVLSRLRQILPWAECASPITGASPSYKPNLADRATEVLRNVMKTAVDTAKGVINAVSGASNTGSQVIATISPKDKVSSGAHLDVRWKPGTKDPTDVPPLDLVGRYIDVGGIPANQLRVTDGPTGAGGRNFGSGRSLEQHPAWDLAFQEKGAIAGAPVSIKNGAKLTFGKDSSSMGSAYADIETPEGTLRLYHLTTGSVGKTPQIEQPTVSPSAISHPSPVTSMPSDPTQEPALNEGYNQQIAGGQDFSSLQGSAPAPANQSFGSIDGVSRTDTSNMSPAFKAQYERVLKNMEGSKFVGTVPKDGKTYGITTGSKEEWAHFFTRNASVESGFNPNTSADINGLKKGPLTSFGLYQMGSTQFKRHGGGNIYDPNDNTKAYLKYAESMYFDNTYKSGGQNVIGGKKEGGGWLGLAAGYGPIRRVTTGNPNNNEKQLLAENISNAEKQKGTYTSADLAAQPSTHTPTPHQGISGPNTNNQALGMFGYASEGQAVWVFFREGDPLSPVYFAASYGQKEWGNMYQYNSPLGVGAGDGGALPGTEAMALNTYGGGLRSAISTEESPLGSNFSFQLYDKNGSNLSFLTDHTEFNSMYNHVNRVLGDNHDICEANKEVRVRGDFNTYTEQDLIITVGNWSDEALAASDEIQQYINEAMQIKSKTS
jgi:SLT domain-containing protein